MNGLEIYRSLQVKCDLDYSSYFDNVKANRLFKESFLNACESIYANRLDNQNAFDEINFLILTDQTFLVNGNSIPLHSILITALTVVGTTWTVTTELPHALVATDAVTLADVAGFTANPNGARTVVTVPTPTTFTFTATTATGAYTGQIGNITHAKMIADYWHYFSAKPTFIQPTIFTILSSLDSTPLRITLNRRSSFRTGNKVIIAGVTGNTNANGTRYLRQLTETDYFLYSDAAMATPIAGNGAQTNTTGTISYIIETVQIFKRSDEKGSVLGVPTAYNPYFQESKMALKILPSDITCTQISLDYLRYPPRFVDVADNIYDFDYGYSKNFQNALIFEAEQVFGMAMRDIGLVNIAQTQIIQQP